MSLDPWADLNSTPLPQALSGSNAVISSEGYVYVIGGSANLGVFQSTVYSAKINAGGTLDTDVIPSAWTELTSTPLPVALTTSSAVVSTDGYIYVMGGRTSGFLNPIVNTIYSAKMNADGTLNTDVTPTAWTALTATPLPQVLAEFCAVLSTDGYVYVMGGVNFPSGKKNTVYSARINAGGTLNTDVIPTAWTELTSTPLPVALARSSAVVSAQGYVYIMGGINIGDITQNKVYSAKMNADGTLSTWTELTATPLPQPNDAFAAVVSTDGFVYVMGGGAGSGTVYSAQMNPDGTLSTWNDLTATYLPAPILNLNAVVSVDKYIYVIGGLNIDTVARVNTVYSAKMNTPILLNMVGTVNGSTGDLPVYSLNSLSLPIPLRLGGGGGGYGIAFGVNSFGEIVGFIKGGIYNTRPVYWENYFSDPIPLVIFGNRGYAYGINDSGEIVGYTYNNLPLYWSRYTAAAKLLQFFGSSGEALGINNLGEIVGSANNKTTPTYWANNLAAPVVMASIEGSSNFYPSSINDSGEIVGYTVNDRKGLYWRDYLTQPTLIYSATFCTGINNLGQIVGLDGNFASVYWLSSLAAPLPIINGFRARGIAVPMPKPPTPTPTPSPPLPVPIADWTSVASSADGTKLVAVVYGGGIYISFDSGGNWTETSAPLKFWISVASSADGEKLTAAITGGGIWTSENHGIGWNETSAPTADWFSVTSSTDGDNLVALTNDRNNSIIYNSRNSGIDWVQQIGLGVVQVMCVAASANGEKLVYCSYSGSIYAAGDYGATREFLLYTEQSLTSVASSADGNRFVAVAFKFGNIWTGIKTDGSWSVTKTSAPTANWISVASSADGEKLTAVINGGGIWTSDNHGIDWIETSAPTANWFSVASSADREKFVAVINGGGIYTYPVPTPTPGPGPGPDTPTPTPSPSPTPTPPPPPVPVPTPTDSFTVEIIVNFSKPFAAWTQADTTSALAQIATTANVPVNSVILTGLKAGSTILEAQVIYVATYAEALAIKNRLEVIVFTGLGGYIIISVRIIQPVLQSNICFPAGTLVKTDQGEIAIELLKPGVHTVERKTIEHITKTMTTEQYLIRIEKDALRWNKPSRSTVLTKDHKIEFEGALIQAYHLLDYSEKVKKVKYTGEILYNVLLAERGVMSVNNLWCETLEPSSPIACIYRGVTYKEVKVERNRFKRK